MAYTLRLEITEQSVNRIIDTLERVRREIIEGRRAGQASFDEPATGSEAADSGSYAWTMTGDESAP